MKESLIQRSLRHKNEEIERLKRKLNFAKQALQCTKRFHVASKTTNTASYFCANEVLLQPNGIDPIL
jgi:hypothetical protein